MNLYGVELIEKDDMVCLHQKRTGKPFEYESILKWLACCGHGSTVIDVGAYTGLYAISAAKAGAHVIAFEPNLNVFERLSENMDANGVNLELYQCAVGAKGGTVSMQVNKSVKLTSGGKVSDGGDIPRTTIDLLGCDNVTAIKIDVEGYECEVLRGALKTIKRCKPLLITEALEPACIEEQGAILWPLGYKSHQADERNIIWSL